MAHLCIPYIKHACTPPPHKYPLWRVSPRSSSFFSICLLESSHIFKGSCSCHRSHQSLILHSSLFWPIQPIFFFKRILNLSKFGLLVFACDLRRGQGRGVGLWQWILAKKYVVVVVDPDAALSAAAIRCAWGCLGGGLFESVACVDYEMRRIIILTCGMMCCSRLFTPEGREPFVRVIWLSNPLHAVIWCNMTMNLLFVQLRSRHIRSQFAWVLNVRKVLLFLTTWRSCKSSLRIPWFLSCFRRDDLELQWFLFSYTSSIPYPTSRIQRCVAK